MDIGIALLMTQHDFNTIDLARKVEELGFDPRCRRYIFNALACISLLLMLAAVALWIDGASHRHLAGYAYDNWDTSIDSNSGMMAISHTRNQINFNSGSYWFRHVQYLDYVPWMAGHLAGFGYSWGPYPYFSGSLILAVYALYLPLWFIVLMLTMLPALWVFRRRGQIKRQPNACPACDYDLTGNTSGQCPECGMNTAAVLA